MTPKSRMRDGGRRANARSTRLNGLSEKQLLASRLLALQYLASIASRTSPVARGSRRTKHARRRGSELDGIRRQEAVRADGAAAAQRSAIPLDDSSAACGWPLPSLTIVFSPSLSSSTRPSQYRLFPASTTHHHSTIASMRVSTFAASPVALLALVQLAAAAWVWARCWIAHSRRDAGLIH